MMSRRLIADLHVHGRFSRGTSKDLSIQSLAEWAAIKGIDVIGTGDFTHPAWYREITESLREDQSGLLVAQNGVRFMWQTEISLIFTQGGKGHRMHLIVLAPGRRTVDRITTYLGSIGRLDYDGRPIFNRTAEEMVNGLMEIDAGIEIIPAHVWTPWFSLFGSRSGFDSWEEAFGSATRHIHALETGLSSDPVMNRRLSSLDGIRMVSFSDLHSAKPWRMGREVTLFDCDATYKSLINAIRTGEGLQGTVEVDPRYGKYYLDGHRVCSVIQEPEQSMKEDNICPVCGRPLTLGVLHRVTQLADRLPPKRPEKQIYHLLPLSELISYAIGKGKDTKAVWNVYWSLVSEGRSEFDVLLDMPVKDIGDGTLAALVRDNRKGRLQVEPGADGVYGHIKRAQNSLNAFFI